MTFSYDGFTANNAGPDLWNHMTNKLNSYNTNRQNSAKTTASDQRDGDARGLIISCDGKAPDQSTLGNTWYSKEFTTDTNYDEMYNECVNFLNSSQLTDAQSYYARIAMTNAQGIDSHLVVFYRSLR